MVSLKSLKHIPTYKHTILYSITDNFRKISLISSYLFIEKGDKVRHNKSKITNAMKYRSPFT